MIDSHCHIDWEDYKDDIDSVIQRATQANVEKMIHIAMFPDGIEKGRILAERYEQVFWAAGCHPHDADLWVKFNEKGQFIKDCAKHPKFVAVGEIGLDFYKNYSLIKNQEKAFREQLKIAQELNLPVIIHCRNSYGEVLHILKEFKGVKGVVHCFSGNYEDAKLFIELGFFISFAGQLTYPKSDELRFIAKNLPLDKILIETDAPFLAPQNVRGKRNEPAFVVEVLKLIASLKEIEISELDKIITANTKKIFNID